MTFAIDTAVLLCVKLMSLEVKKINATTAPEERRFLSHKQYEHPARRVSMMILVGNSRCARRAHRSGEDGGACALRERINPSAVGSVAVGTLRPRHDDG